MMTAPKTLVLIDGHSLAYRVYFALEHTGMKNSQQMPTWAVYGFFNALFNLLKKEKPDAIAVSFDVGRETFRNQLYEAYKAHRESMPDDLRAQMSLIREGVEKLGIPIYELKGYEADDIIGTLSRRAAGEGYLVRILTGDQDSFQLVQDPEIAILIPPRNPREGLKQFDRQAVFAKLGVYPEQVPDFKGLKGDSSDNIPGIPGIGDKTASKLLAENPTLEAIYEHLPAMAASKLKEKLETHRDQAFLSKKLAVIDCEVPIEADFEHSHLSLPDYQGFIDFLNLCEFRTFVRQASELLAPFLPMGVVSPPISQPLPNPLKGGGEIATLQEEIVNEALLDTDIASPQQQSLFVDAVPQQEAVFHPAHTVIQTTAQLEALIQQLNKTQVISLDIETTGLDVLSDRLVGIAIAYYETPVLTQRYRPAENLLHLGEYPPSFQILSSDAAKSSVLPEPTTVYIPVGHHHVAEQLEQSDVLEALKPILTSPDVVKVVHNAKFELNFFESLGIHWQGLVFDTMIASYVVSPERRHGLKILAYECFKYSMQEITELIGTGKKQIAFSDVPLEKASPYAACDAFVTLQLAVWFTRIFDRNNTLATLFYEIEMPLAHVLATMERTGVGLDQQTLGALGKRINEKLGVLEQEVYELAGCTFNLNSPKQVGDVLFEKLQIQPLRKTTSKTAYSTDAKVLEALASEHQVVQKLLDYRQLFKLKSTYVESLPALVHPKTHRVHTSFNQTITATGRLSSSGPNLQNIPIRSEIGREIRRAFVPSERDGWYLLSADYSQIELRLLAHFSEDPYLLEAFRNNEDIHTATAALVFGVPKGEVSKEMRYRAKTVNFGIIYGQSAHGLSEQLKISRAEAQLFIDTYFARYRKVKEYIESVIAEAHQTGKVATICGRVRDLSEGLGSRVRSIREFSERAAFNTPLQGSAADLMKVAMIRLYRRLEREKAQSRIILQVHDELVLEVPEAEVDQARKWTCWAMELDQPLRVPLVVDVDVNRTWMES